VSVGPLDLKVLPNSAIEESPTNEVLNSILLCVCWLVLVLSGLHLFALVLCSLYCVGVFLDADDYYFTDADLRDCDGASTLKTNTDVGKEKGCLHACVAVPTLAAAFLSAALGSKRSFYMEPSSHLDDVIRDSAICFIASAVCAVLFAASRTTSRLISSQPWLKSTRVRVGAFVLAPPVIAAIILLGMALAPQLRNIIVGESHILPRSSTFTNSFFGNIFYWWTFSGSGINSGSNEIYFACSDWHISPWVGAIASVVCCVCADVLVRKGCEALPVARTFSPGEAAVVAQGVGLLTTAAARATFSAGSNTDSLFEHSSFFSNQNGSIGKSVWTSRLKMIGLKAIGVWPIPLGSNANVDYDAWVLTVAWVGLCAVVWVSMAALYVDTLTPSANFLALQRRLWSVVRPISEIPGVLLVIVVGVCVVWCWLTVVLPIGPLPWLLGVLLKPLSPHGNDIGTNGGSGSHIENESQLGLFASRLLPPFLNIWSIAVQYPPRLGILALWALGLKAAVALAGKFDPAEKVVNHHNLDSNQGHGLEDARGDGQIDCCSTFASRTASSKPLSAILAPSTSRPTVSSVEPSPSSTSSSSPSSTPSSYFPLSTSTLRLISPPTSSQSSSQSSFFPSSVPNDPVPASPSSSRSRASSSASWLDNEEPTHNTSLVSESALSVSSTHSSIFHSSTFRHFKASHTSSSCSSTPAPSTSSVVSSSTSASTSTMSSFDAPKMSLRAVASSDSEDFKQFQLRVHALQRRIDAAVHYSIPEEDTSPAASVAGISEVDATAHSSIISSNILLEEGQSQNLSMPVFPDDSEKRRRVVLARKGFHLVVVVLFTPVSDANILSLSYAVALCLLLLVEVVRVTGGPLHEASKEESVQESTAIERATTSASQGVGDYSNGGTSPLPRPLQNSQYYGLNGVRLALRRYYSKFIDSREATAAGAVTSQLVLTPLYLLLGCALPHWLAHAAFPHSVVLAEGNTTCTISPSIPWNYSKAGYSSTARAALTASAERAMSNGLEAHDACFLLQRTRASIVLVALSGVLTLGVGDAVAACVGTFYGRTKWPWQQPCQKRSLEGSAAALVAMLFTVALVLGMRFPEKPGDLLAYSEAAFTGGEDFDSSAAGTAATFVPSLVCDLLPSLLLPLALTCALEAFANAIDNLVLPIYGTALLVAALL